MGLHPTPATCPSFFIMILKYVFIESVCTALTTQHSLKWLDICLYTSLLTKVGQNAFCNLNLSMLNAHVLGRQASFNLSPDYCQ